MATISFEEFTEGTTLVVPQSVINDVEQTWEFLQKNPSKNGYITEDDAKSLAKWFRYAKKYCGERQDGRLKIRKLPSAHLPANQARFTIAADTGE